MEAHELLRIQHEVTSERDPEKRRAGIDQAYVGDLRFLDSEADLTGREAFSDRVHQILDGAPPDFVLEEDGPVYVGPDTAASIGDSALPAILPSAEWMYSHCVTAGSEWYADLPRVRANQKSSGGANLVVDRGLDGSLTRQLNIGVLNTRAGVMSPLRGESSSRFVIVFPFALSANVNDDRREIWGD